MRPNRLREIWTAGRTATNCWLSIPSSFSAERMAHQGWDSVTIDMQHGPIDFAHAYEMLLAVSTTDSTPIVRVPWHDPGIIMRVLDAGAYGVMCPLVNTADEARDFAAACHYAPGGYRSIGPTRAGFYAGPDYVAQANETILTLAQIESKAGLANARAIAEVPGIDVLFVGPSDLGRSLGRPANVDPEDSVVTDAITHIRDAAHEAGKRCGIFCASPDYALAMLRRGFDLATAASDEGLLAGGKAIAGTFAQA
jgi:4-hydroxy-2-oxoheptanedioate aldolase